MTGTLVIFFMSQFYISYGFDKASGRVIYYKKRTGVVLKISKKR